MNENVKMIFVLTLICSICGFLLAGARDLTKEQIEVNILKNVQGPAVASVLEGSTNDLMADRQKIKIDTNEITVFYGKKDASNWSLAFETFASGFGGDVGVIVGYNLEENSISGIGVTTCSETPGIGLKIKEKSFTDAFKGMGIESIMKIKSDGGDINAISGATISSRAVAQALEKSIKTFKEIKASIPSN